MRIILFGILAAFLSAAAFAQEIDFGTGSVEMEATLNAMNVRAKADLGAFSAEVSITFGVSEILVREYVEAREFEPAEVYLALEVADVAEAEPEEVLAKREENPAAGWGVIARELGIKPGSPEFHELKSRVTGKEPKKTKNR